MTEVEYMGLRLKNPVIAAPASTTQTAEKIARLEEAGASAAVMKTLFELEVARRSPSPRFKLIRRRLGPWESTVFYSYEQASPFGPEEYAREIEKAKRLCSIPVIASIGCETEKAWVEYAKCVEQAGADALELDISCPHGPRALSGADFEGEMERVLRLVKGAVEIPVAVKLTGQLTSPLSVAKRLEVAGANGLVLFNRFTGLDIDLDKEAPVMHGSYAGHGGPWSLHFVLRWVCQISPQVGIPIAATGGITSGEDVAKCILCGATAVEVCTAIMLLGRRALTKIVKGFERWMEGKGYTSVDEFRGKAAGRVLSLHEVDRAPKVVSTVAEERCSGCGLCAEVCPQGAVSLLPKAVVDRERCDGCGLCVEVCPEGAVFLSPRPSL
ncbi:MAG TPA: 4Fe-4S dicluster domain-containing protein [Armatimonadetes bacterium]|nr:4Fe-4S dicluster domain-containing protein [Armatimonadota bacterium]